MTRHTQARWEPPRGPDPARGAPSLPRQSPAMSLTGGDTGVGGSAAAPGRTQDTPQGSAAPLLCRPRWHRKHHPGEAEGTGLAWCSAGGRSGPPGSRGALARSGDSLTLLPGRRRASYGLCPSPGAWARRWECMSPPPLPRASRCLRKVGRRMEGGDAQARWAQTPNILIPSSQKLPFLECPRPAPRTTVLGAL